MYLLRQLQKPNLEDDTRTLPKNINNHKNNIYFIYYNNIIHAMFSNQVTVSGKHMICDIKNIKNMDLLHDINKIKLMFDIICETHHFTILNKMDHRFEPQGLTMIYLLAESHISIHTFPERQYAAVDIYTCHEYENNDIYDSIYDYLITAFDATKENPMIIDRTMV